MEDPNRKQLKKKMRERVNRRESQKFHREKEILKDGKL